MLWRGPRRCCWCCRCCLNRFRILFLSFRLKLFLLKSRLVAVPRSWFQSLKLDSIVNAFMKCFLLIFHFVVARWFYSRTKHITCICVPREPIACHMKYVYMHEHVLRYRTMQSVHTGMSKWAREGERAANEGDSRRTHAFAYLGITHARKGKRIYWWCTSRSAMSWTCFHRYDDA